MGVPKARRHFSAPHIHKVASETPSGESEEEGSDAEGDTSPAPAPRPMKHIRPMGGPLAPLAEKVLRDRTLQRYPTRVCALGTPRDPPAPQR